MNPRRIAINFGGGYVPGLNSVVTGVVLAANELGWEAVGIRDGYDGLLFPERYSDGGLIKLSRGMVEEIGGANSCILGTASQNDPFRVRTINSENMVVELDRSDELLNKLSAEKIDAVISVVGSRALSILFKLHRKGLKTICVPESVENDVASTQLSFGFNSALSFTVDIIERVRQAAQSSKKIGVVEVLGEHSGWLALQSAIAVCADAVLIPEIPYDLNIVADTLKMKIKAGRTYGLVIVAEGAKARAGSISKKETPLKNSFKASLSPGATEQEGLHVIERSGSASQTVADELQRITDQISYPLVLGNLVKGGAPTAVDRQLGLAYGAGAIQALGANQSGVMVTFQPPDLKFVQLTEAINKIRVVPADSVFMKIARSLGISLGEVRP